MRKTVRFELQLYREVLDNKYDWIKHSNHRNEAILRRAYRRFVRENKTDKVRMRKITDEKINI